MSTAVSGESNAVARPNAAAQLKKDLMMSLQQHECVPATLLEAPLVIRLLAEVKLRAFSDIALRIRLDEPRKGFKYLESTRLPSAIMQIMDLSSDAFDLAEKNMGKIIMQANVIFGPQGDVDMMLGFLRNPRLAETDLRKMTDKFDSDVKQCAQWAKDTEAHFKKLEMSARELNQAMTDNAAKAEDEKEFARREALTAEAEKRQMERSLEVLKALEESSVSEYDEAKALYTRAAKKGEFSALSVAAARGIGSNISGALNAVIGLVRDVPKVAIATVNAVGSLGNLARSGSTTTCSEASQLQGNMAPTVLETAQQSIDPALLHAKQIEQDLSDFDEMLRETDLASLIDRSSTQLSTYAQRFQSSKSAIGSHQSDPASQARRILDAALEVVKEFEGYGQPSEGSPHDTREKALERWRRVIKSLLDDAAALHSSAASIPGQGFGGSIDSMIPNDTTDDSTYGKVLRERHRKLILTRSVMDEARNRVEKTRTRQLRAQSQIDKIVLSLKSFDQKQTTLKSTKQLLKSAIDVMSEMHRETQKLSKFFDIIQHIISHVCKSRVDHHVQAIKMGLHSTGDPHHLTVAYNERQVAKLRETVFLLRGHFGYVVHSARMYRDISREYLTPCLDQAARLPLSASPEEQHAARKLLDDMTQHSVNAIRVLARHETENLKNDLDARVKELDEDMARNRDSFPLPDETAYKRAVEAGVARSKEEEPGQGRELNSVLDQIESEITDYL